MVFFECYPCKVLGMASHVEQDCGSFLSFVQAIVALDPSRYFDPPKPEGGSIAVPGSRISD